MPTALKGIIHGKRIELEQETDLPDGQEVSVEIRPVGKRQESKSPEAVPPVETWMDRLVFDSAILPGERIVKGTRLAVEALVAEMEKGRNAQQLRIAHPELTMDDVQALCNYAQTPVGIRRLFGAWADEEEELDQYLEWSRQHRKVGNREIEG